MSKMLQANSKINLIEFKYGVKTNKIEDTVLIMQSIVPYSIRAELNVSSSTRLVFWTLFHYNLIPDFIPINGLRTIHFQSNFFKKIHFLLWKNFYDRFTSFLQHIHKKSSLIFMDNSTFSITKNYFNLDISNPIILPICVDFPEERKANTKKNLLNICWVGRIEDFKTSILKHCIKKASSYANDLKLNINFYVVGDGKDLKKIKSKLKNSENFSVIFLKSMNVEKTKKFMLRKIDLVMSMGTAALDGAKLGIPTVLLDASYKKVDKKYRFKWLFESDGSNVAQFIEYKEFINNNHSFDQIISAYFKDANNIGFKCKQYVNKNHSTRAVSKKLLDIAHISNLKWGDLDKTLTKKSFIRKLYEKKIKYE